MPDAALFKICSEEIPKNPALRLVSQVALIGFVVPSAEAEALSLRGASAQWFAAVRAVHRH